MLKKILHIFFVKHIVLLLVAILISIGYSFYTTSISPQIKYEAKLTGTTLYLDGTQIAEYLNDVGNSIRNEEYNRAAKLLNIKAVPLENIHHFSIDGERVAEQNEIRYDFTVRVYLKDTVGLSAFNDATIEYIKKNSILKKYRSLVTENVERKLSLVDQYLRKIDSLKSSSISASSEIEILTKEIELKERHSNYKYELDQNYDVIIVKNMQETISDVAVNVPFEYLKHLLIAISCFILLVLFQSRDLHKE